MAAPSGDIGIDDGWPVLRRVREPDAGASGCSMAGGGQAPARYTLGPAARRAGSAHDCPSTGRASSATALDTDPRDCAVSREPYRTRDRETYPSLPVVK
ncbi:unnamed protein product [Euphydryas editha]|uniref:Uncharacterized protein n=1 Tax=Euphydryas editha TaxID=104508 RepID=A0AAU9TV73_EUPED|nr:unnamed protein product [Euphydryas editha]